MEVLLKGIIWRIIAIFLTIIILYIVGYDPLLGLKIGVLDTVLKLILYYIHDYLWRYENSPFLKTISWRIISTITIYTLSLLLLNNDYILNLILYDMIIKTLAYYIYEKIWLKLN